MNFLSFLREVKANRKEILKQIKEIVGFFWQNKTVVKFAFDVDDIPSVW